MPVVDAVILRRLAPHFKGKRGERQAVIIQRAGPLLAPVFEQFNITTLLRQAHFLAQTCEESFSFSDTREEASGEAYEGRIDLGNTKPGDGARYKGRGFLQLTGRANYASVGHELGLDLVAHPELAETPEVAVRTACVYWRKKHINRFADMDDIRAVTRRINPGYRGLPARTTYLKQAKLLLGEAWIDHAVSELQDDARLAVGRISHLFDA